MSDAWKSVSYLVRCDEGTARMEAQLKDWIEETNEVFRGIVTGLPYLQREMDNRRQALKEMHARIADDSSYRGAESPRHQILRAFVQLIQTQEQDQHDLVEFTDLFEVVHAVRTALGSLADLMEDVECFSVNAIVQAHNAGDRGRGLSQVSREVVSLTKRATLEFARVRSKGQDIEAALDALKAGVERSRQRFEQSPLRGRGDVEAVFGSLDDAGARALRQVDAVIGDVSEFSMRITRTLARIQVDDHCSQVSAHLARALHDLHEQIGDLTNQDNNPEYAGEDTGALLDAICHAEAVFDLVGSLVETLERELAQTRTEMSSFLEGMAVDLQRKADSTVDVDDLLDVIRKTRAGLEDFVRYMRELVSGKAEIVSRAEALAGQIFDLRDDLEGVRRTAKRFGVMASIIKVELASAGLSEEFGDALSADRVENLYRDMASAVGSVLIALDSSVKQVQRRCGRFRQGLVRQEDTLRQAEGYTSRLVKELDGSLVRTLTRGGSGLGHTLAKLHRECTALRLEVGNIMSLSRQSGRIRQDARSRQRRLLELKGDLLRGAGLEDWQLRPEHARRLVAGCTIQSQREAVRNVTGSLAVEEGSAGNELTLF